MGVPGVASARSLARESVRHNTRATQVRGIRAANPSATEQSQDGGTGNRSDARPDPGRPGRLPTHLTDLIVEQVTLFCLREDGFAQELRVLPVSRSAPGPPTVITPEVRTIGGIAGTRRRAAWQPQTGQDPVGTGRSDWRTPTSSRHPSRSASSRTSCSSSPSPPPRPHGREQAAVFTGADAASRFQRRSSAAPALFQRCS
jgi:hypothetical protein